MANFEYEEREGHYCVNHVNKGDDVKTVLRHISEPMCPYWTTSMSDETRRFMDSAVRAYAESKYGGMDVDLAADYLSSRVAFGKLAANIRWSLESDAEQSAFDEHFASAAESLGRADRTAERELESARPTGGLDDSFDISSTNRSVAAIPYGEVDAATLSAHAGLVEAFMHEAEHGRPEFDERNTETCEPEVDYREGIIDERYIKAAKERYGTDAMASHVAYDHGDPFFAAPIAAAAYGWFVDQDTFDRAVAELRFNPSAVETRDLGSCTAEQYVHEVLDHDVWSNCAVRFAELVGSDRYELEQASDGMRELCEHVTEKLEARAKLSFLDDRGVPLERWNGALERGREIAEAEASADGAETAAPDDVYTATDIESDHLARMLDGIDPMRRAAVEQLTQAYLTGIASVLHGEGPVMVMMQGGSPYSPAPEVTDDDVEAAREAIESVSSRDAGDDGMGL